MTDKIEELEWKCSECGATAPPTSPDYMKFLRHQTGHHIHLVNKITGEILATTVRQARKKGIDIPSAKTEAPAEAMEITEEGITFPITLPPVVFTLFDAAKAAKLVDSDMDLDSWLFECVQSKFKLDYGLKFMLVPIGREKK